MADVSQYIRIIFILLVASYIADQYNQIYRLNLFNYKNLVKPSFQNLIEGLVELSLSMFSMCILYNTNVNLFTYLFLIFFALFYLVNGVLSFLVFSDNNNTKFAILNEQVFYCEFVLTKFFTLGLFYVLYVTFF